MSLHKKGDIIWIFCSGSNPINGLACPYTGPAKILTSVGTDCKYYQVKLPFSIKRSGPWFHGQGQQTGELFTNEILVSSDQVSDNNKEQ